MDATEHLIHIAEQIGDGQLGGIAWGRLAKEARAELDALRAAPPIDEVPTVPGWYWHREKNSRLKGVPWNLVWTNGVQTLSEGEREILLWAQPVEEGSSQPIDIQDFEFAEHEFCGPLTPPKGAT